MGKERLSLEKDDQNRRYDFKNELKKQASEIMQNTELFEVCILRIKQEKRRELREKKRLMIEEEKNRIEE